MNVRRSASRQKGTAAIEFAVLLPFLVLIFANILFLGKIFWHYTVAQKIAHDMARHMSTQPAYTFTSYTGTTAALNIAYEIARQEGADLNTGGLPPAYFVLCGKVNCAGMAVPATVTGVVQMRLYNSVPGLNYLSGETEGYLIQTFVTMPYVGN